MAKKVITKGKIGNALTSTAADHIVAVADDIFDEALQQYQSEINHNNTGVMNFLGVAPITSDYFTDNAYIKTAYEIGSIIDIFTTTANNDYRCAVIECKAGNKFTINSASGELTRLWAFVTTSGKLLSVANAGTSGSNIVIEAPKNTKYLILNDYGKDGTFYVGEGKVNENEEKVSKMIRTITNDSYLSALIDGEGSILAAIRQDGSIFIPKGMSEDAKKAAQELNNLLSDEVRTRSRFIRELENENTSGYLYAVLDGQGKILLAAYEDGTTFMPKGVPEEVKLIVQVINNRLDFLEVKVRIAERSDYILAFVDKDGNLLGGWKNNGEIFIPSGMSEDAKKEFAEIHKTVDLYEGGFAVE